MAPSALAAAPVPARQQRRTGTLRRFLVELGKNRGAIVGAVLLIALVLTALAAPLIAPYDPIAQEPAAAFTAPEAAHWFGTDNFGRDILSRVLYGGRISLWVGTLAVVISGAVGSALGLLAGFRGGRIDSVTMRAMDVLLAFPGILLALIVLPCWDRA